MRVTFHGGTDVTYLLHCWGDRKVFSHFLGTISFARRRRFPGFLDLGALFFVFAVRQPLRVPSRQVLKKHRKKKSFISKVFEDVKICLCGGPFYFCLFVCVSGFHFFLAGVCGSCPQGPWEWCCGSGEGSSPGPVAPVAGG